MDVHFLKYSQAPIISPLHKPLRIEMYNDKYFNPNHLKKNVKQPSKYQASNQVDLQSFKTHSEPKIPPTKELTKESGADLTIIEEEEEVIATS